MCVCVTRVSELSPVAGAVPLGAVRVVVLRGAARGRRRVARARAGAQPARRAPAARRHARDGHALALRRAHLHQEGESPQCLLVTRKIFT